jgi:hypothetical protein
MLSDAAVPISVSSSLLGKSLTMLHFRLNPLFLEAWLESAHLGATLRSVSRQINLCISAGRGGFQVYVATNPVWHQREQGGCG